MFDMTQDWKNQLYFGDNLDILKDLYRKYPQGFIDLIYIDPPFNSKRNYNVLFESVDLTDSTAQKEAFADTWSNVLYMDTLNELAELDISLHNFLKNLNNTNLPKGAISYLVTMAIRLWYMHKLLKPTGSFYLHCDQTMSHYLKILCDLIIGEKYFNNEIIWHYRRWTGKAKKFQKLHDIILYYTKTFDYTFNILFTNYTEGSVDRKMQGVLHRFKAGEEPVLISNANIDEKGVRENDVWMIPFVAPSAKERLGYPTQKPEALMERIITASSNEGDLVADFFCGCGTTIAVAQKLNRQWLGVDISHLAVRLIAKRLIDSYGDEIAQSYDIHGFPKDLDSARELANNVKGGRLEFEGWIIEVMLHGIMNERRNEMGFDGYRTFNINGKKYIVMIEVKSGNASPTQLNHFIKTVEDKRGAMGVFVCFADQITRNMQLIAKKEGLFVDDFNNSYGDKIQIISVEDLLEGKRPLIPQSKYETFKKAEKKSTDSDTQIKIDY